MSASILIGDLSSPALYVSGFVAEAYTDATMITKIGSASCKATQTWNEIGYTWITQPVTASDTPQLVSVSSVLISGMNLTVGSVMVVDQGLPTQEVIELVGGGVSSTGPYIIARFTQTHATMSVIQWVSGLEPNDIWVQSSLMLLQGLTAGTSYFVAVGVVSPGGAINWGYMNLTATACQYSGLINNFPTGLFQYFLTDNAPPGDLLSYQAISIIDDTIPISTTTSPYSYSGTSLSEFSITGIPEGSIVTTFVRAVGTSGNYPWVAVDSRLDGDTLNYSAISTQAAPYVDTLVPYLSGLTTSAPPPNTLYNPSFESGSEGWILGTNWGIGEGHACFGKWSAYVAGTLTTPLITASTILNGYQVPAVTGQMYFAQCMIDGSSASGPYDASSGIEPASANVYVQFYDVNSNPLAYAPGNVIALGGTGWNLSRVVVEAPVNAAFFDVGCVVNNQETGTVFVDDFSANQLPMGPVEVPDGPVYVKLANVAPDHNIHISTAMNPQGSLLPNQPIPLTYTYSNSQIQVNCAPISVLRADGSVWDIVGGNVTVTGLTAVTTYYLYPYIRVSDGTLQIINATNPSTTPSPVEAMQAEADGCVGLGPLSFSTISTGSGITGLGVEFGSTIAFVAPEITVTIAGDGTGAWANVSFDAVSSAGPNGSTWEPELTLHPGTGYTTATATVTVVLPTAAEGYVAGTTTYPCTLAANVGSVGGATTCPESAELVDVLGKGKIKVGDVKAGDRIKGFSIKTSKDVYRRVKIATRSLSCTWRIVDGYRCSPAEPVYYAGQWTIAHRVPGATHDTYRGYKVKLTVEADDYNEQNYYLVSQATPLLIHNQIVSDC